MAKSVLEKMYCGEFAPHEYVGMGDDELLCMSNRVDRLTEAFTSKLSDSLKAEFEALEKEKSRMGFREGMLAYADGFRCGVRLSFEVVHGTF